MTEVIDPLDMIFVVGASRSGTTMLARVLGLHSDLHTLEETHYFGSVTRLEDDEKPLERNGAVLILSRLISQREKGIFVSDITAENLEEAQALLRDRTAISRDELFRIFVQHESDRVGKKVPVEQTPRNVFFASKILELYPGARVIEIVRDPRAVLYSQRKRWRVRFSGRGNTPWIQTFRVFVNYHALTMSVLWTQAVRAGMRLGNHSRFYSIRYEDLVAHPESTLKELCQFLSIEFQTTMLNAPHTTSSTVRTDNSTSGFYISSLEEWRGKLPRGDLGVCALVASSSASSRGYNLREEKLSYVNMVWHMLRYPLHLIGTVVLNPERLLIQVRSVLKN